MGHCIMKNETTRGFGRVLCNADANSPELRGYHGVIARKSEENAKLLFRLRAIDQRIRLLITHRLALQVLVAIVLFFLAPAHKLSSFLL